MILKIEYIERIRRDDDLLLLLAKANEVRVATIERWMKPGNRKGNRMLTTAENLAIIAKQYGVETTELLDEDTMLETCQPEKAQK